VSRLTTTPSILPILFTLVFAAGCKSVIDRQDVRPRVLRDVPARNLAYRFSPDVSLPGNLNNEDSTDKDVNIANHFAAKRADDALLRTIASPDGKRILALYGTESEPASAFRIDLYSADGEFLRNLIPPDISCVFPEAVAWSPDGRFINFIAHKKAAPSPSPTPVYEPAPELVPSPTASPSVAPIFAPVASFVTEQIYICNRDGYDLKPLTTREGLIYFYFAWAPDGHALVALACKEDEWNVRERQFKLPAGRPRLIQPDGSERLLDDALTDALPVWSPDASKVATAFDTDIAIYDAGGSTPTQGRVPLGDQLISASVTYEEKSGTKKSDATKTGAKANEPSAASPSSASSSSASSSPVSSSSPKVPSSFNPIVRLQWPSPETLYFQTAYVRVMPSETINTFQRWHLLSLSAQAAILK
jgi:hypothetical protein